MVANADEIRKYVLRHHIQPAIREGRHTIEVRMLELEEGLKRGHDRAPYRQAIRAALTTQDFQIRYNAIANEYISIAFTLNQTDITGVTEDSSFDIEGSVGRNPEFESKEDIIAKLHKRIDELTHDEFESIVRAYAKAKGFSNVELSLVLKLKE